jgi:hypothetical protein
MESERMEESLGLRASSLISSAPLLASNASVISGDSQSKDVMETWMLGAIIAAGLLLLLVVVVFIVCRARRRVVYETVTVLSDEPITEEDPPVASLATTMNPTHWFENPEDENSETIVSCLLTHELNQEVIDGVFTQSLDLSMNSKEGSIGPGDSVGEIPELFPPE